MTNYTEDIYWADVDYIKWGKNTFEKLDLNLGDIRALCELGFPEWAAPNINFEIYDVEADQLKLGEDRDDRDIIISFNTYKILVGDENQLINSSVFYLRKALQLYAIMIEKSIVIDEDSFVENRINDELIKELKGELRTLDPECLSPGSFWTEELLRLRPQAYNQ